MKSFANRLRRAGAVEGSFWSRASWWGSDYYVDTDTILTAGASPDREARKMFDVIYSQAPDSPIGAWRIEMAAEGERSFVPGPCAGVFWAYHPWLDPESDAGRWARTAAKEVAARVDNSIDIFFEAISRHVAVQAAFKLRGDASSELRASALFSGRRRGRRHRKVALERAFQVGVAAGLDGRLVLDAGSKSNMALKEAYDRGRMRRYVLYSVVGFAAVAATYWALKA